jgi:hypothetical protein
MAIMQTEALRHERYTSTFLAFFLIAFILMSLPRLT